MYIACTLHILQTWSNAQILSHLPDISVLPLFFTSLHPVSSQLRGKQHQHRKHFFCRTSKSLSQLWTKSLNRQAEIFNFLSVNRPPIEVVCSGQQINTLLSFGNKLFFVSRWLSCICKFTRALLSPFPLTSSLSFPFQVSSSPYYMQSISLEIDLILLSSSETSYSGACDLQQNHPVLSGVVPTYHELRLLLLWVPTLQMTLV